MRLVREKHEKVKPGPAGRMILLTAGRTFSPYKHFDWHTQVNSDPAEHAQALLLFKPSCKKVAKSVNHSFLRQKK